MTQAQATDVTGQANHAPTSGQLNTIGTDQSGPVEATKGPEDQLSPKFAALARKEKAIRQRELAIKAREAEIATSQKTPVAPDESWKSRLQQDFWSVMNDAGYTPDQITQLMLNQPGPQDIVAQQFQKKLQAIEERQQQILTQQQDRDKQQYEAGLKQIRNDVSLLVDGDESFETIKSTASQDAVVELIRATFDESGELMSVDQACKEVEDYLVEQAMKLAQTKKIQQRLMPQPAAETQQQQPTQKPQMNTLSNRMVNTTAPQKITMAERVARAKKIAAGLPVD